MTFQNFKDLYLTIPDYESQEMFIMEQSATDRLFDYDENRILGILEKIYMLKDKDIKIILDVTDLTQAQFSREYFIPLRTVENWIAQSRTMPEYMFLMLAYAAFNDAGIV